MSTEIWKPVVEGRYLVSNLGHIRSAFQKKGTWEGRNLKGSLQSRGYLRIHCNELGKDFYIHRLVAEAFFGPCPEGYEVNHIDGNKANNAVENLEYCTRGENVRHSVITGLALRGTKNGNAKITEDTVREIRRRCALGESQRLVGLDYGLQQMQISRIVRRERWAHVV
jgi:hypothetical protein